MSCGKNCLGYVDSLLFKCGLDKPNSMSWTNYLRMRWCIVLYLIFALMGVIPLFILAGSSCSTVISTVEVAGPQPLDVFFCMDTSLSLSVQEWIENQAAVASLMDVFTLKTNERNSSLQLGYVTFLGAWWSNNVERFSNESLRDLNNLTVDVDFIRGDVQNLPDNNYLDLGTNFDEPLMECQRQFAMHGQEGALEVCVLVTDGKDLWPDGCLRHDFVNSSQICGTDPKPIAAQMKDTQNVMILGVYIGEDDESAELIFNLSSCSEIPGATRGNCTWEADAEDNPSLQASAEEIVSSVVNSLDEKYFIQLENCIDPEHAVLLLMIIPLILAVSVSFYVNCIKSKETIIRKIAISDVSPAMIPPNLDHEPAPTESKRVGRATAISTINFNGAWKSGGYIYVQDQMTQEEVVQEELKKFLMCIMPCCTFVVYQGPSNSNSSVMNSKSFPITASERKPRPDKLSVISESKSIDSRSTGASKIQRSNLELSTRSLQSQGTDNRALPAPPGGYRNRSSAPALPPRPAPALPPRQRNTINTKSAPPTASPSLSTGPKSEAPTSRSNKSRTVPTRPLPATPKAEAPSSKARSKSRPLPPRPVTRANGAPSLPPRPNVNGSPGRRSRASLPPISQDRVPPPAPQNSDSQLYKI